MLHKISRMEEMKEFKYLGTVLCKHGEMEGNKREDCQDNTHAHAYIQIQSLRREGQHTKVFFFLQVVASTSENPLEQLNRLSQYLHQQLHQTPARFPKWFSPNILKFCVLLHDVTAGDLAK